MFLWFSDSKTNQEKKTNKQTVSSPPFVLTSNHQREVKQNPKEEPPSNRDPQAIPFANLRDPLLLQNIDPRRHTRLRRHVNPQNTAHTLQQTHLHIARKLPQRRVIEYLNPSDETLGRILELVLQHPFVRVLHQREVMEPDPVERDPIARDEESWEEEEVSEDRNHHGEPEHHVRYDAG